MLIVLRLFASPVLSLTGFLGKAYFPALNFGINITSVVPREEAVGTLESCFSDLLALAEVYARRLLEEIFDLPVMRLTVNLNTERHLSGFNGDDHAAEWRH
jgi:hypothetical protein